jgi:antitoxin (DNA-binding transcriptional repressor) of toxin-antitoxin stability system
VRGALHDFDIVTRNVAQSSHAQHEHPSLRDTRKLKAWLRAGKTVELRDRDKVLARIVPAEQLGTTVAVPDFAARRKKIFGDRVLPGADIVAEERGRY